MAIRVKEDVVVDTEYFLRPMSECPKGKLVLLKVFLGGTVKGTYSGEVYYTGWAPLPKEPEWLKALEQDLALKMRSQPRAYLG